MRKRLLTLSLLLALMAISSVASAGIGVSDKRYWPNEVGPNAYRTDRTQDDRSLRRALKRTAPRPQATTSRFKCRYLGGPKFPIVC